MIRLQAGNPSVIDDPSLLPRAKYQADIASSTSGVVTEIMCEHIGTAGVLLGGGREKKEDSVDPAVGIIVHKKLGDQVSAGEPLCTVHYNSEERFERARPLLQRSYTIGPATASRRRPLVGRVIGGEAIGAATR
jgi:thymidine phosphorylase